MSKIVEKLKNIGKKIKRKADFKNNKVRHIIGLAILAVQLVMSIVLVVYMNMLDILPDGLYALAICALIVAFFANLALNITKKLHIVGKAIGVLAIVIMSVGCYFLHYAMGMLEKITSEHYDVDNYLVVTLVESEINKITDVVDKEVGISENTGDKAVLDNVAQELEKRAGGKNSYKSYEDISYLIDGLYNGEVEVVVYMEAYNAILEETIENFVDTVKIIDTIEVKTLTDNVSQSTDENETTDGDGSDEPSTENDDLNQNVQAYDPALDPFAEGGGGYIGGDNTKDNSLKGPITDRTFNVYISGIDRYGKVSGKSRSDVNILMTVNPMTKEIILTNTPRDYYVPIPGKTTGTWRDKLTHAGIYGVWYSVATLENIYDVEIDYYVRVNFTSFIDIIKAIGGIDVYSEYAFTVGDYKFTKGINTITDGFKALAFARERKSFADGDNQRGKNQMAVIEAIIDKAISPALLTNFVDIVNTISTSLQTNMTMDEITALAKMQLNDGGSWTIKQQNVTGTGASRKCYSWRSSELSVQLPDQSSINECRATIKALMAKGMKKEEPTTTEAPTTENTTTNNPPTSEVTNQEESTSENESTSIQEIETSTEETSVEDESTEEVSSEEDTTEEVSSEEGTTEEDTTQEDTTQEDTTEQESTDDTAIDDSSESAA